MSRRSTLRCKSCRATYWSDDAHRCGEAKPRRWRKVGPHEYALRMGPVTVRAVHYNDGDGLDLWTGYAYIDAKIDGNLWVWRGSTGAPLAQCQADAIAAVERWRDGIR